jgi:hypothetical protein
LELLFSTYARMYVLTKIVRPGWLVYDSLIINVHILTSLKKFWSIYFLKN